MKNNANTSKINRFGFFSLICIVVISFLAGCETKKPPVDDTGFVAFLFSPTEDEIVASELEIDEAKRYDAEYMVGRMVDELISPTNTSAYRPVLDARSGFLSAYKVERQVVVDFSGEFLKIDSVRQSLIRAALTRSFTQISGIDTVFCTIEGEAMQDSFGNVIGPMSADMFIDNAGAQINPEERTDLVLYFANANGDELVPITRTVVYSGNISMDKLVVEQLLKGPQDGESGYPVMNSDLKIINVTTQDGTCYVNLDRGFLSPVYNITNDVAIYSIVDSLIELGTINKVQIMIDSDSDVWFRESVSLNTQFERNLDIVAQ